MKIEELYPTDEEIEGAKIPILEKFAHHPLRELKLEGIFQLEIQGAIAKFAVDNAVTKLIKYVLDNGDKWEWEGENETEYSLELAQEIVENLKEMTK